MRIGKYLCNIRPEDYNENPEQMMAMSEALRLSAEHYRKIKLSTDRILADLITSIWELEAHYGITFLYDGEKLDDGLFSVEPDFENMGDTSLR